MAGRRARPTDGQVDDVPEKHRKLPDTADDAEEPAEEAEVEVGVQTRARPREGVIQRVF